MKILDEKIKEGIIQECDCNMKSEGWIPTIIVGLVFIGLLIYMFLTK